MNNETATIIGFFSDAWDAERALENLRAAGFNEHLRYIQNESNGHGDSSKTKGGISTFFAKIYGFEDEDEYSDARGNWSVSPEAEAYFAEAYHLKHHVLLIHTAPEKSQRATEILRQHNGKVEQQTAGFFHHAGTAELSGRPTPYPPLAAIEPALHDHVT